MKTGVFYFRYSPGANQTAQSIDGQRTVCSRYAKENEIEIVGEYIDEFLTGTTDRRPDFQRMLRDSKHSSWEFVVCYDIERFGRNKDEIVINRKFLRDNGKLVLTATQIGSYNIDGTRNLSGILLEGLHESYAEYYSAELSQKVKRGQNESIRKGFFLGSFVPYGYYVKGEFINGRERNKKFYINENQANIIREMFSMYNSGKTIQDIIAWTKENKIYNQKNRPFSNNAVTCMLQNEKYLGIMNYGIHRIEDYLPPIIDKDEFMKTQDRFKRNKRVSGGYKADKPYILSTKLICTECGAFMFGESGTSKAIDPNTGERRKHYYYKCTVHKKKRTCKFPAVSKDWIEDFVVRHTVNYLFAKNNILQLAEDIHTLSEKFKKHNSNIDLHTSQIRERETAIDNLLNAIEQGIISKGTKDRLLKLESEKEELETQLITEQAKLDKQMPKELIIYYLEKLQGGDINDFNYKCKIIDMLVEKVFLYKDKVVIVYKFDDGGGKQEIDLDGINGYLNDISSGNTQDCGFVHKTVSSATISSQLRLWGFFV